MAKRIFISLLSICFIILMAFVVISYSRGYRFDPKDKSVKSTGILSVSSYPEKSSIFLDGKLVSATDASLNLSPNWYDLKISKEGYQSWQKRIRVQGEVASQVDALLIPNNPSLRALTMTGVMLPVLSPSLTRVAYFVPDEEQTVTTTVKSSGLWILELKAGTLGSKPEPKKIYSLASSNYQNTEIFWSPDEKEIILTFLNPKLKVNNITSAVRLNLDNPDDNTQVAVNSVDRTLSEYQFEQQKRKDLQLVVLDPKLTGILSKTTDKLSFSPDEFKILYSATGSATIPQIINPPLIGTNPTEEKRNIETDKYYVYDLKEDKNFYLGDRPKPPQKENVPIWYTDSKHLVMIEKDSISIVDYDGTNKRSVYSGPFTDNIVYPWGSGGKIVILTNFNKVGTIPNLYEVDLR